MLVQNGHQFEAAPKGVAAKKKPGPRRIRAQSVAVGSDAKTLASEMAAAAAAADLVSAASGAEDTDPPDFEVTFNAEGPLGITWSSELDKKEVDFAYIKGIKPGGQASKQPDITLGLILSHINGKWCKHVEYFKMVQMIRAAPRPLVLGFCGKIAATALPVKEVVLDSSGPAMPCGPHRCVFPCSHMTWHST